jgi:hypothetical protein
MSNQVIGREADPFSPRVRKFFDNRHVPYRNLTELRSAMVEDDKKFISFIGSRMIEDYWLEPVTEPLESARSKVGELAKTARAGTNRFPELVNAVFAVLASETSPLIGGIDPAIIDILAERTNKAMLATAFKYDRGEGIAPAQQALNQARAVQIAQEPSNALPPGYGYLATKVHDVYGVLVPKTANELQQDMFSQTCIDDWDAGLAGAFRDLHVLNLS